MSQSNLLWCPHCQKDLSQRDGSLFCSECNKLYKIKEGIPIFVEQILENINEKTSARYWDGIWSQRNIKKHLALSRKKIEFYLNLTGMFNQSIDRVLKNSKETILALEVGCGGSQFMPYFIKKLKNVDMWGFDRSFEGCKLATSGQTHIICADIFSCPLRHNSFDFVYDFTVIHHFKKPEKLLEVYAKLLKTDGVLTCVVPNLYGLLGDAIDSIGVKTMTKISEEDLRNWLNDLGLKEITVKPVGGIHPLLMIAQSYRPESQTVKENVLLFTYNYIFALPLMGINLPLLFRSNSKKFSPFLMAQAIK